MSDRPPLGLLLAAGIALGLSACATTGGARAGRVTDDGWFERIVQFKEGRAQKTYAVRYRGAPLPGRWERQSDRTADFSFYNSSLGATIYADTSCGVRYEDAPLTVLINHLLMGFTEAKTIEQTERELGGRGALSRTSTGRLDGVPVGLGMTVVRKGPCVFDLVYISPRDGFEAGLSEYEAFVQGFEARVSTEP